MKDEHRVLDALQRLHGMAPVVGGLLFDTFPVLAVGLIELTLTPAVLVANPGDDVRVVLELPAVNQQAVLAMQRGEGLAALRDAWTRYLAVPERPVLDDLYAHYKGGRYRVVSSALLLGDPGGPDEHISPVVVYKSLDQKRVWVRGFVDFTQKVSVPRFARVADT